MARDVRHRWRFYSTPSGRVPVREFLTDAALPQDDRVEILAGLKDVQVNGLVAARHVRGEIYEVRVAAQRAAYRLLFAQEGSRGQVLLALVAFSKKTQRTPSDQIELAERRLRDWRRRSIAR